MEIEYSQYALVEIIYGMEIVFPLHRVHEIELMLVLTCLIGMFHLYIAWALGFRNIAVMHGIKEAIMEKGGWLIALTGSWILSIYVVPIMMSGSGIAMALLKDRVEKLPRCNFPLGYRFFE